MTRLARFERRGGGRELASSFVGVLLAGASILASCGTTEESSPTLASFHLFADSATQTPAEGVMPYELVAPLFSDYATKHRFLQIPEGTTITIGDEGHFVFPEGTVIGKTFGFREDVRDASSPEHLVETRILELRDGVWHPYVYLWNDDGTEATPTRVGGRIPVSFVGTDGTTESFSYRVPSVTQCGDCHGGQGPVQPLGPRVGQLDRMHAFADGEANQLDRLVELGWLASRPTDDVTFVDPEDETADIDARGRSYLHANCAHCHRQGGASDQSGLWFDIRITEPVHLGICKPPAAAGRATGGHGVDVWPGRPDDSIVPYRMASTEAGIRMPESPATLSHREGVEVVRAWITAMPEQDCE